MSWFIVMQLYVIYGQKPGEGTGMDTGLAGMYKQT
jgi:hypothetical protein